MKEKYQELLNEIAKGPIPSSKVAARKYIKYGGKSDDLLLMADKQEKLNPCLIIAYFIVAANESEGSVIKAWDYLKKIVVDYEELFTPDNICIRDLPQDARDIIVSARKYLITPETLQVFVKVAKSASQDRIARSRKLLTQLEIKHSCCNEPYEYFDNVYEWCIFEIKFFAEVHCDIGNISYKTNDVLKREICDDISKASVTDFRVYKILAELQETNDLSYIFFDSLVCSYYLDAAIKIDDINNLVISKETYISICGKSKNYDEYDMNYNRKQKQISSVPKEKNPNEFEFNQTPTVKLNLLIGCLWEQLCQRISEEIFPNVITNKDSRIRLPNNSVPDIAYGEKIEISKKLIHAPVIIECKKSLYFLEDIFEKEDGKSSVLNSETTDKYYEYCDELQYWILEKPADFVSTEIENVKVIFAEDLPDAYDIGSENLEYLRQIIALDRARKSKILRYMNDEERTGAFKTGDYWSNDDPQKWIRDISSIAPAFNITLEDLIATKKQKSRRFVKRQVIRQYDLTGKFIKEYLTVQAASKMMNTSTENIAAAAAGRRKSAAGYLWKRCDENSAKENIAVQNPVDLSHKIIIQINDEGVIINQFKSVSEAAKSIGIHPKGIRDVINGRQKTAGGYHWGIL